MLPKFRFCLREIAKMSPKFKFRVSRNFAKFENIFANHKHVTRVQRLLCHTSTTHRKIYMYCCRCMHNVAVPWAGDNFRS